MTNCPSFVSVIARERPHPPAPEYFGAFNRSRFSRYLIINAAVSRGYTPATQNEINAAHAASLLGGPIMGFSYSARFWAAIRRMQLEHSRTFDSVNQLAIAHGLTHAVVWAYRDYKSVNLDFYYAADQLDEAAQDMGNN